MWNEIYINLRWRPVSKKFVTHRYCIQLNIHRIAVLRYLFAYSQELAAAALYMSKSLYKIPCQMQLCVKYHVYVKMSVYVIDYSIDVQYVFCGLRGQWNYFCATFYTLFNKPFTACTYFLLHFVYSYIICHILLTAFVNSIGLMFFRECTNIVLLQHIL